MKLVNDRKLPVTFLAGNSINYTMPGKLSSVEAFAASLIIAGYHDQARFLLSKFNWGHTFWELNLDKIEDILDSSKKLD
jgi:pre-rRNA-processing protein TSR3